MEREQTPLFVIDEMKPEDIEEATKMRLDSWLDTYQNDEFGISREWITRRNQEQLTPKRMESRLQRFHEGKTNGTFNGWVARDSSERIIGSTTPFIEDDGSQRVGSIYVDKNWHSTGVGSALMQKVVDWFDPEKPIYLGVVTYNDRAKAFYRKWGFVEIPGSETLFDNKIPEVKMVRKASK